MITLASSPGSPKIKRARERKGGSLVSQITCSACATYEKIQRGRRKTARRDVATAITYAYVSASALRTACVEVLWKAESADRGFPARARTEHFGVCVPEKTAMILSSVWPCDIAKQGIKLSFWSSPCTESIGAESPRADGSYCRLIYHRWNTWR